MNFVKNKKSYFILSFTFCMIANIVFHNMFISLSVGILAGMIMTVIDEIEYGISQPCDLLYSTIGTFLGVILYILYLIK